MSGYNGPAGHGSAADNETININTADSSPAGLVREARVYLNTARRDWENQTDENANPEQALEITNEYREALLQVRNTLDFHLQLVGIMNGGRKTKRKARKTRRR